MRSLLASLRQARPAHGDLASLTIVAGGVVIGFPLLTALALQRVTSARSIVFIGLLPLATAPFGVWRGGERPRPAFRFCSYLGGAAIAGFAYEDGESAFGGNVPMVAAILLCSLGYAEGATLSRRLGGWPVIAWALVLSPPLMAVVALITRPGSWNDIRVPAWLGLAYVSAFSMLMGFVFWYRGLARGGIAGVGQLRLLQTFFGLALASVLCTSRSPGRWSRLPAWWSCELPEPDASREVALTRHSTRACDAHRVHHGDHVANCSLIAVIAIVTLVARAAVR